MICQFAPQNEKELSDANPELFKKLFEDSFVSLPEESLVTPLEDDLAESLLFTEPLLFIELLLVAESLLDCELVLDFFFTLDEDFSTLFEADDSILLSSDQLPLMQV